MRYVPAVVLLLTISLLAAPAVAEDDALEDPAALEALFEAHREVIAGERVTDIEYLGGVHLGDGEVRLVFAHNSLREWIAKEEAAGTFEETLEELDAMREACFEEHDEGARHAAEEACAGVGVPEGVDVRFCEPDEGRFGGTSLSEVWMVAGAVDAEALTLQGDALLGMSLCPEGRAVITVEELDGDDAPEVRVTVDGEGEVEAMLGAPDLTLHAIVDASSLALQLQETLKKSFGDTSERAELTFVADEKASWMTLLVTRRFVHDAGFGEGRCVWSDGAPTDPDPDDDRCEVRVEEVRCPYDEEARVWRCESP